MGSFWSACTTAWSIIAQFRPPAARWSVDEIPDLNGQVFLVTGASSGIGKACATVSDLLLLYCSVRVFKREPSGQVLARKGGRVYCATRSEASCREAITHIQETTGKTAYSLVLDLSSFAAIEHAARKFLRCTNSLTSWSVGAKVK